MQEGEQQVVESLSRGDLESAEISESERGLLEAVRLWTLHAYRTTDAEIHKLEQLGWTQAQIAEAVYITALFAFFNRVADAFGLEDPGYGGNAL